MIKSLKKQQGITMISGLVIGVFLMFQIVIAMNVIPVYLTDSSISSVLSKLPSDVAATKASSKELKSMVLKRLGINSVYTIKPEHVKVKKGRDQNIVIIEYEPRGTLIGNLEYIVSFKHEVSVPTR